MRIKNVGRSTIIFNGGSLEPNMVAVFQGNAEKLGATLLRIYPNKLIDLDNIKKEDVIDVVIDEPKVEEPKVEEPKVAKPKAKKGKSKK